MPLDRAKAKKGLARSNGQDLMRGEHIVGENRNTKANSMVSGGGGGGWKKFNDERAERTGEESTGTSIFDPVLCELAYRWFCPKGGSILDPFAGGSVRGIVAAWLGFHYTGIDLSERQIEANRAQAETILKEDHFKPEWIVGDSSAMEHTGAYDFVFSCPPYGDLEVYSEDERDLSMMPHDDFLTAYRAIIARAVAMLRPDRFACFVVGDFRDAKGYYRNFVSNTIDAFQQAGAMLYNEAILVTSVGSLPIRVGKQFGTYRKLGKTHQNFLVFCKGDFKKASQLCKIDQADLDAITESLKAP